MRPKDATLFNQANLDLLKKYWEEEYADRDLVDSGSAWNRLVRAVEAVGPYSLLTASKKELQTAVNQSCSGSKQRQVISALNQLLRHFRAGVKLRRAREIFKPIRYVTEPELKALLARIANPMLKLLCEAAFATGCRVGELFALAHLEGRKFSINRQLDTNGDFRATKNRKERDAVVVKGYEEVVQKWIDVPFEEKLAFRNVSFSRLVRKASKEALGREIVLHDLRHSYCIYWLAKGLPIYDVAAFMGDTVAVIEKYYAGFIATPEALKRAQELV